jgi:RNA-directed DNA polymerase
MRQRVSLCINSAVVLSQEALLRQLNPLIRGWADYYRHGASKRTLDRLDNLNLIGTTGATVGAYKFKESS